MLTKFVMKSIVSIV